MAASGGAQRQPRRGPAPIASFDHDHDGSDEVRPPSSPETKTSRLPEIREDPGVSGASGGLVAPEQRARSASTPGALQAPGAPRIDISRASSSSHQDSRDSSPELALFAGASSGCGTLGFREDGALELRSSTEELAFLEPAPTARPAGPAPPAGSAAPAGPSRKDSQGSEAALLAVSGRTSRLSSVGSQCSALSALSRVSRLSAASGVSRSPSPHKMLLETSFCGPKPIETDPEICAAAEERLLEITKLSAEPAPAPVMPEAPVDARDRREVRTEATVERPAERPAPAADARPNTTLDDDKKQKETRNKARAEERQARPRERRDQKESRTKNRSKDIIRIRLKPDNEYDDDDIDYEESERASKPVTLELTNGARRARPTELAAEAVVVAVAPRRVARESRTPSPAGGAVSRKSSFCSLFKSRETIASPESPSEAQRRKKSLNDGRSRSRSRDRSATPTSATKIRGSVLSLFRTPRKSATSPSPSSRDGSPVVQSAKQIAVQPSDRHRRTERLKYYEDAKDGIIHIPLRTPPGETGATGGSEPAARPASAPQARLHASMPVVTPVSTAGPVAGSFSPAVSERLAQKPIQRTVLPDGSIIIPLHSPTEKSRPDSVVVSASVPSPEVVSPAMSRPVPSTGEERAATSAASSPAVPSSLEDEVQPEHAQDEARPDLAPAESTASGDGEGERSRRRERLVFTTHVGSRDQVFSTQFSITKTPSVTSEISGSFPSFQDTEGPAPAQSPQEARDSSGSEASWEAARGGSDVEQRGLVVQQSFDDELPYVPTTLPQERSLALPMVPVRERGGLRVAAVQRPRPARPDLSARPDFPAPSHDHLPARPAQPQPPRPPDGDKLRIRLPRRPRTGSASAPPLRPERARSRSGSEGLESRPKAEWIDFEEVPERRKQPKRIQTLPTAGPGPGPGAEAEPALSYVAPEDCRCECHHHDHSPSEGQPAGGCGERAEAGRS